jgi:restriction endonuclease S subunit
MSSELGSAVVKNDGNALFPTIRFPEFQAASGWHRHRLGDICKLYQPETISSSEFEPLGQYPVYGANGVIGRLNRYNHEFEEVAISCRGYCGEIHFTEPFSWVTGNAMIASPSVSFVSKQFLYHLLIACDLSPIITGSAQPQITRQALSKFVVALPSSAEQRRIVDFLASADSLIEVQKRRVKTLREHKKALMQQLFPQQSQAQAALRFPEFEGTGEWSVSPLRRLGDIVTGKTPSTTDSGLWGGNILFITPTDISNDAKYQRTAVRSVVMSKNTKVLPAGSILYTCIASIGKMAITDRPSVSNQQINAIIPNDNVYGEFIYYSLDELTPWIKTIPASTTLPIINKSDFSDIEIVHPAERGEQMRVADCLASLDDLISVETQKLDTLKAHKKGLMEQLFPQIGEADL